MWQLTSISANNFMSFNEVDYSFNNKVYVIKGENKDNESQASNGSGKTSFTDIIAIALLGYSLTGRNLKDCVGWSSNENFFTITTILENKERKLKTEIKRKFYSNTKSAELILLVNGETPKTIPTKKGVENGLDIREGNRYILNELLDINEEDLLNYFLISKKHYQPFLQVNTDRKLEVIGRFTNTTAVDKVIAKIEAEAKLIEEGITYYNTLITQAEGYTIALNDSMNEDSEIKWQAEKDRKINNIEVSILDTEKEVELLEQRYSDEQIKIDSITLHIIDLESKENLYEEYKSIDTSDLYLLQKETNEILQIARNYMAGLITCPSCNHKFNLRIKETYTQEDIELLELEIENTSALIKESEEKQELIKLQIAEIQDLEKENKNKEREKLSLEKTLKSIEVQKERLLQDIEKKLLELDTQSALTFMDAKYDIQEQIKSKESELITLVKQLTDEREKLSLKQKWIDQFYDFKFYLGGKPLKLITSLVNQYLELSGSDLNLQIEGFKKLRSGELRQSLTPMIYRNWLNPKDYNSFSAGEQCRLNIATDLAFQQLINASSKSGGLNVYLNDEIFSPVDSLGVANVANSFNNLDKTILLVTHSAADMNFNNVITIEKKNNKSKII